MEALRMACMSYPTTVVVVDDNPIVLKNIQLKIGRIVPCEVFSVPEQALDYLGQDTTQKEILEGIMSIDIDSDHYYHDSDKLPLQCNVSKIHQNVYEKNRFAHVSLVIIDYAMPSMNGEEFAKTLRQQHGRAVKIILLTGEADDHKAIQLFNAGVIDKFFRKTQQGIEEDLKACALEMQGRYFQDMTFPIVQGISSETDSSLGDPAFITLFNEVCRDIAATSYYLIELSGSFLFFDNAGKPTWLIIKTLHELQEIAQQIIEPHISEALTNALYNGEVVPYFGPSNIWCYSDEEKLKASLFKAKRLEGKQTYCYALLDALPGFTLKHEEILSFDQYMSTLP